jgi:hypothetical protein
VSAGDVFACGMIFPGASCLWVPCNRVDALASGNMMRDEPRSRISKAEERKATILKILLHRVHTIRTRGLASLP